MPQLPPLACSLERISDIEGIITSEPESLKRSRLPPAEGGELLGTEGGGYEQICGLTGVHTEQAEEPAFLGDIDQLVARSPVRAERRAGWMGSRCSRTLDRGVRWPARIA